MHNSSKFQNTVFNQPLHCCNLYTQHVKNSYTQPLLITGPFLAANVALGFSKSLGNEGHMGPKKEELVVTYNHLSFY